MHRALLLAAVAALVPLAALLSLGGCASGGGGKLADVLGGWVLAELTGTDLAAYDAVVEARPELELHADGRVGGFGGVNRMSGSFDADAARAGRFEAGPIAATMMAGPPPAMQVERAFLGALDTATQVRVEGGRLVLAGDAGVLARFTRK